MKIKVEITGILEVNRNDYFDQNRSNEAIVQLERANFIMGELTPEDLDDVNVKMTIIEE